MAFQYMILLIVLEFSSTCRKEKRDLRIKTFYIYGVGSATLIIPLIVSG